MKLKKLVAGGLVCCYCLNYFAFHRLAHSQVVELGAVGRSAGTAPGIAGVAGLPRTQSSLLMNPALQGGIAFSALPNSGGLTAAKLGAPSAAATTLGVGAPTALGLPVSVQGRGIGGGKTAVIWEPSGPSLPDGTPGSNPNKPGPEQKPGSIASPENGRVTAEAVKDLAQSVAPLGKAPRSAAEVSAVSGAYFDRSTLRLGVDENAPAADASGATGGVTNYEEGAKLGRLYPRVVVILDTLDKPAAEGDALVSRIESLVEKGVRVVFVTPRAEKGENSAESMLVSKLKVRTGNPVIVVSYNGARVASHSSRAENPKPLIEDLPGFAEKTIAKFREIDAVVRKKLGAKSEAKEFGVPSVEKAYIYGSELPEGVDAGRWIAAYNGALRSAGFPYRVEVSVQPDGKKVYFTQSTALRLNTARIFSALYALAPELDPAKGGKNALKPQQVLVLADPATAPSFLRSLPGKGHFIHGITDSGSAAQALGAVLGDSAFEKVTVQRHQLRDYIEWLERRERYGPRTSKGGFARKGQRQGPVGHRELAFFRGILMKDLMGRIYHLLRKGQYAEATLDQAKDMLHKMWYNPRANGVFIPEELEAARTTASWKALQRGYLDISKRWLSNYYHRNFRDYPRGVSEKVAGRLINLSKDGKNSVPLDFVSPYTRRRYVVYVLPDRAELWEDDKGYVLTAHVYRTGKEPYASEFDESVEVNLVGRAMLEGYAEKRPDGKWYVNDEADPRVQVIFHYNTRTLGESKYMTPAEVEAETSEVTALIEKRQADKDYQAWLLEQEKRTEKAKAAILRAAKREARKKNSGKTGDR